MSCYIGVDIGGTKMYMHAEINGKAVSETIATGKDCTSKIIKENIEKFVNKLDVNVHGIGIAVPGLVENSKIVVSDVLPHLSGKDEKDLVPNIQCRLINDVRAATIYESSKLKDTDNAIVIMNGTGIACGIFTDGKILNGYNGFAGELGSIPMTTIDGVKKLDELSSGAAILKKLKMTPQDIISKLDSNDEKVIKTIQEASYYLGLAISNLIHIINPNNIILGGSTVTYKGYFDNVIKIVKENTLKDLYKDCNIKITDSLKEIVALGAIQNLFQN